MPTKRQEQRNPGKADETYETAVRYLISQTRDTAQFRLVFLENCHYGFRRNMLGMRNIGLGASIIVGIASVGGAVASHYGFLAWKAGFLLAIIVCLGLCIFWWRVVNSAWVRSAADEYAERLLDSLDVLPLAPQESVSGTNPQAQS